MINVAHRKSPKHYKGWLVYEKCHFLKKSTVWLNLVCITYLKDKEEGHNMRKYCRDFSLEGNVND